MTESLFGIDYGLRRIGVAVGSPVIGAARPLATIANRDSGPDWAALDKLVAAWSPAAMVLGVPYNDDGSEGELTDAVQVFGEALADRYGKTVHRIDEHLSSVAAAEALVARRRRGDHGRLRSGEVDAAAAAVILDDWFSSRSRDSET